MEQHASGQTFSPGFPEAQGGWIVSSPKGKTAVHSLNSAPPPNCTMWLLVVGGGLLSGVEEENHQPSYHLLIALYPLVFFLNY